MLEVGFNPVVYIMSMSDRDACFGNKKERFTESNALEKASEVTMTIR